MTCWSNVEIAEATDSTKDGSRLIGETAELSKLSYAAADLVIGAHLAGVEASAGEIAQVLGHRVTAPKVYKLLTRYGTLATIEEMDPHAVIADTLEQALADCKRVRRAA
jgi:hypothetical protein